TPAPARLARQRRERGRARRAGRRSSALATGWIAHSAARSRLPEDPARSSHLVAQCRHLVRCDRAVEALDDHAAQVPAAWADAGEGTPDGIRHRPIVRIHAIDATAWEPFGLALTTAGQVDLQHARQVETREVLVERHAMIETLRVAIVQVEQHPAVADS